MKVLIFIFERVTVTQGNTLYLSILQVEMPSNAYSPHQPTTPVSNTIAPTTATHHIIELQANPIKPIPITTRMIRSVVPTFF